MKLSKYSKFADEAGVVILLLDCRNELFRISFICNIINNSLTDPIKCSFWSRVIFFSLIICLTKYIFILTTGNSATTIFVNTDAFIIININEFDFN